MVSRTDRRAYQISRPKMSRQQQLHGAWAAALEDNRDQALVRQMKADKEKFLTGVRERCAAR